MQKIYLVCLKNCPAVYWLLLLCLCVLYDGHDDVTLDVVQEDVAHQDGAGVDKHTRVRPGSEISRSGDMTQLSFELNCSCYAVLLSTVSYRYLSTVSYRYLLTPHSVRHVMLKI